MRNSFGQNYIVTQFGESRGEYTGVTVDSPPAGLRLAPEVIRAELDRRRPQGDISTSRHEADSFTIVSGVYNGYTTGSPLTVLIPNTDTGSGGVYDAAVRPSHADYTSAVRFGGYNDPRSGGHLSGRLTAALVAAGAVTKQILNQKNIFASTHILRMGQVRDRDFADLQRDIKALGSSSFPVLDEFAAEKMRAYILSLKQEKDSAGGILETVVTGLPAGTGEPFFDTVEGVLAHALFSVPGVKGVEFGAGFGFCDMKGSEANDEFYYGDDGRVMTRTNHSGGINGGMCNGMPVLFRCAVRPTPSVGKPQKTVDILKREDTVIEIGGRNDPAFIHRAAPVIDAMTCITLADLMMTRFGSDYFTE